LTIQVMMFAVLAAIKFKCKVVTHVWSWRLFKILLCEQLCKI